MQQEQPSATPGGYANEGLLVDSVLDEMAREVAADMEYEGDTEEPDDGESTSGDLGEAAEGPSVAEMEQAAEGPSGAEIEQAETFDTEADDEATSALPAASDGVDEIAEGPSVEEMEQAAVKIQSMQRGRAARARVEQMRAETDDPEADHGDSTSALTAASDDVEEAAKRPNAAESDVVGVSDSPRPTVSPNC